MRLNNPWILIAFMVSWLGNPGFSFSEEIRYHAGNRRDPFVPVGQTVSVTAAGSGMVIEGIVYDVRGKSLVVIGGEAYKVGDSIGVQRIIEIQPNKVVVSEDGKENKEYWISTQDEQLLT